MQGVKVISDKLYVTELLYVLRLTVETLELGQLI